MSVVNPDETRAAPVPDEKRENEEISEGSLVGDYVIKRTIASGGCGTVYEAEHRVLGRRAAVKVLSKQMALSPEMVARFIREARAVNMIRHANIVDIHDFGEYVDGRPYYVMELLDGPSLDTYVKWRGRLAPSEAIDIMEPICAGLKAAHDAGVVHRDLKGSNIIVVTTADARIVKIVDFGIAKLVHQEPGVLGLTEVGRRLGTPHAMAPEQIHGIPVDKRADIYSLGVLLYKLLTGRAPFESSDLLEIERLHLQAPPPRPSQSAPVPPALDDVVLKSMEKDPEKRYPTVSAFLEALREAAGVVQKAAAVSQLAVGIYVEVRIQNEEDEMDDEVLDDIAKVLDAAQPKLREAGFLLPIETGNVVLGVMLLDEAPEDERRQRQRTLGIARNLFQSLTERPDAHPRVHVNVCVHVDKAVVKNSAQGPSVVGGGILRINTWAPDSALSSAVSTTDALKDIGAPSGERYVPIPD